MSPDSAPQGLDAAVNKEITAIWAQVQNRVKQLAGDSKIKPNLTVDGVLSQLDYAQCRETPHSKYTSIRSAFNNTLQLIQFVGDLAAGAAAEVGTLK